MSRLDRCARHHPPRPRGQPAKAWRSVRLRSAGAGVTWPLFRPLLGPFSVPWRARPHRGSPTDGPPTVSSAQLSGVAGAAGRPVQRTEAARDCSRRHMCHPPSPATWPAQPQAGRCSLAYRKLLPFCHTYVHVCENSPDPGRPHRSTGIDRAVQTDGRNDRAVSARGTGERAGGVRTCRNEHRLRKC